MKPRMRQCMILAAAVGFFILYGWGLLGLPGSGRYPGPYGDVLNARAEFERHASDVVSAINFDYRAFDTLGEEFILFTAVMGVVVLLRRQADETSGPERRALPGRSAPPPSDAVRALALGLSAPLVVFGLYIITHGQISPGGGFQGGVILASTPLFLFLCGDYRQFCAITSHELTEAAEAAGAGVFALIGLLGTWAGLAFLQNGLPLGKTGSIASSGTIAVISFATGIEVCAGLVLVLMAYFDRVLVIREGGS